jgi:hypothetical protein
MLFSDAIVSLLPTESVFPEDVPPAEGESILAPPTSETTR